MTGIVFERHHGEHSITVLEDIADLYTEIHEQEPYDDPIFSRESFIARTSRQAQKTGFELLTARKDNELAGFSFGYTMPTGDWWEDATPPQHNVLGSSKFAVIELDVANTHRGQGLGKELLGQLLADRSEDFATLAALQGTPAHAMYLRWRWYIVGSIGGEGPVMDAMLLPLRGPGAAERSDEAEEPVRAHDLR